MNSENQPEAPVDAVEAPDESAEAPDREAQLEAEMAEYPLREPGEDPKWAIATVVIWLFLALGCIAFIVGLLVLGAVYD